MLSPYAPICEVLFYISCSIHAHIHTLALTSFTPTPPAAASAGSTQRQAKCMLMRARPMVEPHSFWEEMAFNNGGPRGDFAQSSAPLWKMHSIHCCICSLFFSCFFPLRWEEKKKKNSRNIFVSPLPPLASVFMLGEGGGGGFGVLRSRDLSLQKHQKQEHQQVSLNSVQTLSSHFSSAFCCSFAFLLRQMSPEAC